MDTKERVEWLLKNYHGIKRSLDRLNFEIERFTGLSYDKVIDMLNFTTPEGERVTSNRVSDKSGRIALGYREHTEKLNNDVMGWAWQYHTQKSELDVLEYCITLLEPKLSEVITDMFINKMTWTQLCDKYHVSVAMIGKYRKKGITEICGMYDARMAVY
ncbi:conserved hypothetical protein [Candidatus Desulfosporosinus infrequens]|uniref:Uncharacterized protein n=1 Tax=Candidatus Desulfosporosinus infrequens TaxID=2043169 RepID=A0A2U3KM84_9FIRM|nr:conserved hypothetical protein [Candidatus Desulfosporosinus infrequens]